MKVIEGNFGAQGKLSINKDGSLTIEGSRTVNYSREQIEKIDASSGGQSKGKGLGFAVASILVILILMFFSVVGGLFAAIILLVIGSLSGGPAATATIHFTDGQTVEVQGSRDDVDELYRPKPHSASWTTASDDAHGKSHPWQ